MRRFLDDRVVYLRHSDLKVTALSLRSIAVEVGWLRYRNLGNFLLVAIRRIFTQDWKLTVLVRILGLLSQLERLLTNHCFHSFFLLGMNEVLAERPLVLCCSDLSD